MLHGLSWDLYPHPDFHALAAVVALDHKRKVTNDVTHQHLLLYRQEGESRAKDLSPELAASQSHDSYWEGLAGPSKGRPPRKGVAKATVPQVCTPLAKTRVAGDLKCWRMARFATRLHPHQVCPLW